MANVTNLRQQFLRVQRESYRRRLREARETLEASPVVLRYGREYHRGLKKYRALSSWSEVMKSLASAQIVYHGDYHPLRHSQRCILSVLNEISEKRETVLCLEMFHGTDQKSVDGYLAGAIGEKEFLKKIRYAEKWAYNWNPWKRILDLCRERKIPVLGINSEARHASNSLRERDVTSAQIIGQTLIRNPNALIYVVDGDYHVAPEHLPAEVEKRVAPLELHPTKVILYQNAETLYWKLAEEGHEEADVVQVSENSFCLMNTVPTTKIQAYLDWLQYAEDGYSPVWGDWAELSGEDYLTQIRGMVKDLGRFLGLECPQGKLDRLTVYSNRNLDFGGIIELHPSIKKEISRIKAKIRRGEGFLLEIQDGPEPSYVIYLQEASVNQAAEEATHFLNVALRGPLRKRLSASDRFYREVMTEALGFIGSKTINERRKVVTEWKLRTFLGRIRKSGSRNREEAANAETSRFLLQHHHLEQRHASVDIFLRKFSGIIAAGGEVPHRAATQLGYMLGNKLFYAVKKGYMPISFIRTLFSRSFEKPDEALIAYLALSRRMQHLHTSHGRASLEAERTLSETA